MDSFRAVAGDPRANRSRARLGALNLTERGALLRGFAEAYVAAIPLHVAQRELEVIGRRLGWPREQLLLRGLPNDVGPGNAVTITLEHEHVTEVFTGFGERGVRAEIVAGQAADGGARLSRGERARGRTPRRPIAVADGAGRVELHRAQARRTCAPIAVIERFTGRRVAMRTGRRLHAGPGVAFLK